MKDLQELPREIPCRCGDEKEHTAIRNGKCYECPLNGSIQIYKPAPKPPQRSLTFREIVDGISIADFDDGLGAAEVTFDLKTGTTALTPVSH